MTMTDDYAARLLERRARIFEAWMDRVLESQMASDVMSFWGAGVVIDSKGTLRMTAFAPNSWNQLWELECKEDGVVVFTRHDT
jgi:hypothetical protein